jgi:hypothetical protein
MPKIFESCKMGFLNFHLTTFFRQAERGKTFFRLFLLLPEKNYSLLNLMKKLFSFLFPAKKTSLLALSIATFTNEKHLSQIFRQGRIWEYSTK